MHARPGFVVAAIVVVPIVAILAESASRRGDSVQHSQERKYT